ncbi:MAG TPA: hypothetical protein PLX35_03955 [Cyclobacteriaceae bacterium]|nr:hypothetical protein [Cyclobacteriaceae bacterium]
MESAGFRSIVDNFTQLNSAEAGELERLAQQHPYSQLIHLLRARSARDLKQSDAEERLHHAAVYATDRAILKFIMTSPAVARIAPPAAAESAPTKKITQPDIKRADLSTETVVAGSVKPGISETIPAELNPAASDLIGDALRDDIYIQLEKLKKSKHDFEVSLAEFSQGVAEPPRPTPKTSRDPIDPLLDEIKSTKKKIPVQNPKAQEQNQIIEEFIRKEPVLPKPVANAESKDLAEDSSLFSDNIVSETLVDILLKQGKKEKAIEVLKKLIWKFPQKKAYFAAQIESLKG